MKPKTAIVIQASLISWEGGRDLCANVWDGRTVVEHTVERVCKHFADEYDIFLLAPDIPQNRQLIQVADPYQVGVVFGPFDDVVSRYCLLPNEYEFALKIAGVHPFFSKSLARDLLKKIEACPHFDFLVPPEALDIQLATHLFSLTKLRESSETVTKPEMRIDPIEFLRTHGGRSLALPEKSAYFDKDRELLRKHAINVYQDDILHSDISFFEDGSSNLLSQIFRHYSLAAEHLKNRFPSERVRILDIGGGPGFGKFLSDAFGSEIEYYGLDIDLNKLLQGREKDDRSRFICGDGFVLPFRESAFDGVLCFELLEHIDRPAPLIGEALRIVGERGQLFLSTPQNRSGRTPINPHHQREYTVEEFQSLVEKFSKNPLYYTFLSGSLFKEGLATGNNMMAIVEKAASPEIAGGPFPLKQERS